MQRAYKAELLALNDTSEMAGRLPLTSLLSGTLMSEAQGLLTLLFLSYGMVDAADAHTKAEAKIALPFPVGVMGRRLPRDFLDRNVYQRTPR